MIPYNTGTMELENQCYLPRALMNYHFIPVITQLHLGRAWTISIDAQSRIKVAYYRPIHCQVFAITKDVN